MLSDDEKQLSAANEPKAISQTSMWDALRHGEMPQLDNPLAVDPEVEARRRRIARHKLWIDSIAHEYPSPYYKYRIGIYIRYFNQTKYDNYLDFHKKQFVDTINLCPNWSIVDFYVDEGQSAPHMENAAEWTRLLNDCVEGKVDLIITQKVSNVSRNPMELTFCARFLATLSVPVGMYFVSEDIFTLASYYLDDLHEDGFLPADGWTLLEDGEDNELE